MKQLQQQSNEHSIMNFVKHERFFGRDITNLVRVTKPPSVQAKKINEHKRNSSYDISRKTNIKSISKTPIDQYLQDICDHVIQKETIQNQNCSNVVSVLQNTKQNRCEALSWLFNTHHKYQLFEQTLFMAIWIFDTCFKQSQFMNKIDNSVSNLSITALYMASKYEETYRVPKLRDLLALRGSFTSEKQIIKIEGFITQILDFNFIYESSFKYLQMLAHQTGMSEKNFCLAQYILELSLLEPKFFEQRQSLLGCGVFYLVNRVRKVEQPWPSKMHKLTNYKEKDLQKVASAFFTIFENADSISGAEALKKKFLSKSFHEVANLRIQRRKSGN